MTWEIQLFARLLVITFSLDKEAVPAVFKQDADQQNPHLRKVFVLTLKMFCRTWHAVVTCTAKSSLAPLSLGYTCLSSACPINSLACNSTHQTLNQVNIPVDYFNLEAVQFVPTALLLLIFLELCTLLVYCTIIFLHLPVWPAKTYRAEHRLAFIYLLTFFICSFVCLGNMIEYLCSCGALLSQRNLFFQICWWTQLLDKSVIMHNILAQVQQTNLTNRQHPEKITTSFSFLYVSSYRIKHLLPSLYITRRVKTWLLKDLAVNFVQQNDWQIASELEFSVV